MRAVARMSPCYMPVNCCIISAHTSLIMEYDCRQEVFAPLPGGCREDGASALLTVVFNGTMVTVSFTGATVFLEGQWVCANAESWLSHGVNVTYDLYVLQLNTSSERDLFQGISKMYAVQDIRRHATKVRTFPAGALQYSASLPVRPGLGRVYSVVASVVHSSMSSSSRNDGGDGDG
eukprot:scpid104034/ scgid0613/ 